MTSLPIIGDGKGKIFMDELSDEKNVTLAQSLKSSQILNLAMGMGAFSFLLTTFVLQKAEGIELSPEDKKQAAEVAQNMILAYGASMVIVFGALFVFSQLLKPEKLAAQLPDSSTEDLLSQLSLKLGSLRLIEGAIVEFGALFGTAIVLLNRLNGLIEEMPILWLGYLGPLVLFTFLATTFPTVDRIKSLAKDIEEARDLGLS